MKNLESREGLKSGVSVQRGTERPQVAQAKPQIYAIPPSQSKHYPEKWGNL